MNPIEIYYRSWWKAHLPSERAALLNGVVSPDHHVEPTFTADGDLLGMQRIENDNNGTITLPMFIWGWDPDDDNPTTTDEDEER